MCSLKWRHSNLYEEGKVCLSILGTWAGDAAESWSAAKSSLFQVFLSIQGLVLVKEPFVFFLCLASKSSRAFQVVLRACIRQTARHRRGDCEQVRHPGVVLCARAHDLYS